MAVELAVPGEPRPKSRPRFVRGGGVYSTESQREHERLLAMYMRTAFKRPLEGGVAIGITFFRSTRRRVDLDNLLKAVLDAANGIVFADDSQIMEFAARLELDRENPRTVILVEPKITSMM